MKSYMKIFCDASNLHVGGGKTLILDFIHAIKYFKNVEFYIFVDPRLEIDHLKQNNINFITINKFLRYFVCFYINLNLQKSDYVIYLGNIPPVVKNKCFSTLYLGNRYLVDEMSTRKFSLKTRLRLFFEKLMFIIFKNNVNEIIVQSESMKNLLMQKIKEQNKIKIFPFLNKKYNKTKIIKKYKYDFIYIASDEPHKNHKKLLESWHELSMENIFPSLCLVLPENSYLIDVIKRIISSDV